MKQLVKIYELDGLTICKGKSNISVGGSGSKKQWPVKIHSPFEEGNDGSLVTLLLYGQLTSLKLQSLESNGLQGTAI